MTEHIPYPADINEVPGTYSQDWFKTYGQQWWPHLAHVAGAPHIHVLEIGVWEGKCARWLLDRIVTHPTSTYTGIDNFQGGDEHFLLRPQFFADIVDICKANLAPHMSRVDLRVGDSATELLKLQQVHPTPWLHFVYVDGSHRPWDVVMDAWLAWQMLRVGGVMVFDDYIWFYRHPYTLALTAPCDGIDKFLAMIEGHYELLHQEYQVRIRKLD